MTIYIDADSCPIPVRNIIFRACKKNGVRCVQAANRHIPHPKEVEMIITDNTEGAADDYIIQNAQAGDLIVTRDIPLAAELVKNDITVINDRGDHFEKETIAERLSIRNTMAEFRAHGILEPTQRTYDKKQLKAFADCFDRLFQKMMKQSKTL